LEDLLDGEPAILPGFIPGLVPIADEALIARTGSTHHKNIIFTGNPSDSIRGMVFTIHSTELEQADKYEEEANYKRILVELQSGKPAWVYVSSKGDQQ
jgi:AIG2-like family.